MSNVSEFLGDVHVTVQEREGERSVRRLWDKISAAAAKRVTGKGFTLTILRVRVRVRAGKRKEREEIAPRRLKLDYVRAASKDGKWA